MRMVLLLSVMIFCYILVGGCTEEKYDFYGNFTISARNMSDNSLVKGGKYELLDSEKNVVKIYTLDDGAINITDVRKGVYTVRVNEAPGGYYSFDEEFSVIVGNDFFECTFYCIPASGYIVPESMKVKFYSTERFGYIGDDYNAVRIGEYYWIDRNFNHFITWGGADFENIYPMTQDILNKYMQRIFIDPQYFQVDTSVFEKYYGRYYSYPSILYMNKYGQIHNDNNVKIKGWRLPYAEDYRQLFAMCPFNTTADTRHEKLNERDVRFALSSKSGDNPMAFDLITGNPAYKTYWFDSKYTNNMYKFNLMPGGARLNGDGRWCNGMGPDGGCYNDGKKGDIYHLFYAAILATGSPTEELFVGNVTVHDYVFTEPQVSYHMMNVRWCRPLSDAELGYKLYINAGLTDIKKLDLDTSPPEGYTELPHGYIRGFYVQYMLDNPNAGITVSDIVRYARSVDDNYVFGRPNYQGVL